MRTSVIRLILSGILNSRRGAIGLAALAILCIGLVQTGADETWKCRGNRASELFTC